MPGSYRLVVSAVLLLVFGLLYYLLILSPAISKQKTLVQRIKKREGDLVQMVKLRREWEIFTKKRAEAERRLTQKEKSFTLLSFLEGVSRSIGVDRKIQYMKPLSLPDEDGTVKPEGIEISLDGVDMKELVSLLYKIEYSGKAVSIKRIKIQKNHQGQTLKVTLQAHSYSRV